MCVCIYISDIYDIYIRAQLLATCTQKYIKVKTIYEIKYAVPHDRTNT